MDRKEGITMKGIKLIAISKKGKEALQHHIKDSVKLPWNQRVMFKQLGWSQIVTQEDPFTVEISLSNKRVRAIVKAEHITAEIQSVLKSQGALIDTDYTMEVEK